MPIDYLTTKRECKAAGKCGACQTLNLTYDRELSLKMKKEITLLGRFGHIEEIIPMDVPLHYRNKSQYLFSFERGRTKFGLYRASDNGIVSVDSCMIEDKEISSLCRIVRKMVEQYKLTVYDGRRGLVRHVMARKAFATGEILCAIVTSNEKFPKAKEFAEDLAKRCNNLKSVSQIINNTSTPLWMGGEEHILYGNGTITDVLCGCEFKISAKSFYQINPKQTEILYKKAVEFAQITKNDNILDSYCGIGTVGIIAAKEGCASLTAFDVNADAIVDAESNAKRNGITNAKFVRASDASFLLKTEKHMNVIFADPPRAGCDKKFLNFVLSHKPEKLVYISCNPETLARDLRYLESGYKVKKIQPVDMFPGTAHVETVCLLSKREVDSKKARVEFSL